MTDLGQLVSLSSRERTFRFPKIVAAQMIRPFVVSARTNSDHLEIGYYRVVRSKHPYNEKKVWAAAHYLCNNWVHQPSKISMPALSHWHAANMDGLVRAARIKKNFEDYYWGALVLTESYVVWGGANLNAYTMIGLDLRWIDMIGTDTRRPAVPRRHPPPSNYIQLIVKASRRKAPGTIVGFPGAQVSDLGRPVTEGDSVIWGFAVPRSPAEQMMDLLNNQMSAGRFGTWGYERDSVKRILARVDGLEEPKSMLEDSILHDGSDEELARFGTVSSPESESPWLFCVRCGVRNPDDANFCAKCGAKLVKL